MGSGRHSVLWQGRRSREGGIDNQIKLIPWYHAVSAGDAARGLTEGRSLMTHGGRGIYAPRDEPGKMRSAMIADPEGNIIETTGDIWN